MSETKIYIDFNPDQPHVGIIIYKDGWTTRIDGNQSAGFLTPQGSVPVDDPSGVFGNVIIELNQAAGVVVPTTARELNLSPSEIDAVAQSILDAVLPQSPPSNMTKFGPLQSGLDDPDFLTPAALRSWIDLETPYNPSGFNSNSVANTILAQGGLDFDTALESVGVDPYWYAGKNLAFDSNGDDTIIIGNGGLSGGFRVLDDNGGNDIIRIQKGNTTFISNDDDPTSSNKIILEGYDHDDVELKRSGDNLLIIDKATGKAVLVLLNHFGDDGASTDEIGFAPDENGNGGDGGPIQFDPTNGLPTSPGDVVTPWTIHPIAAWVSAAWNAFWAALNNGSPLVLDLDGDGIELVSLVDSNIYWDIDQDGFGEAIGWVQSDDGFLAIDANSDGIITDHSELFGSVAEDGFTDLALLDSNSDNIINASDTAFSDLLVWRDLNQNGLSESNELFSLTALNIVSINLNATTVNQTNAGHDISHVSTYTVDDGVSGPQNLAIVDVWFQYDDINTSFLGDYTLDATALLGASQRGYGTLPDFYIAASLDNDLNDPDSLLSLLTAFAGRTLDQLLVDDGAVAAEVEAILLRWAGVEGVDPASRGPFVDARKLEFLEELFGREFLQNGQFEDPDVLAADEIHQAFDMTVKAIGARIIVQGAGQALFTGSLFYNPADDSIEGITGLNQDTLDSLVLKSLDPAQVIDKVTFWKGVVSVIDQITGIGNLSTTDQTALQTALAASDSSLTTQQILDALEWHSEIGTYVSGTTGDDTLVGTVGNDTLFASLGNDSLMGGLGDDELYGGPGVDILVGGFGNDLVTGDLGADIFKFYAGHGNDILRESGTDIDTLEFGAGVTLADLEILRVSNTALRIAILPSAGTGSVTVDSGNIEILKFSDNSTFDLRTMNQTLIGTSGNDTLRGMLAGSMGTGSDTIHGMDGNDIIYADASGESDVKVNWLYGGNGNDALYGDGGNDELHGEADNDTLTGNAGHDKLVGGAGDDTANGGAGDDRYVFNYGDGHDTYYDTAGADRIVFGAGITAANLNIFRISNDHVKIEIDGGAGGSIVLQSQTYGSGYVIETLEFADASTVSMLTVDLTLNGTAAGETLYGVNYGGSGVDTIYGHGGNDIIYGYRGSTTVHANFLYAGDGDDQVHGGSGVDTIEGNAGNDTLRGYNGNDTIDGGDGNDTIYGGSQDDLLVGGAGDDKLLGDNNNDILIGGLGADELTGGTGADTFRFLEGQTFDAVDTIKDFNTTQLDVIDIRDILEGYDPQTSAITDFVQITTSGSNSLLAVDADGGGDNFIQIAVILNKTGLTDEAALLASGRLLAA